MVHHERFGTGQFGTAKLLVCLHGWGMNSELEKADFELLFAERGGWERLYLDLPGMGQSPADPHVENLDDLLGVLLGALDSLTAGRPFALSGTSAGGYLARGVAAARQQQLLGLLLRVPKIQPGWVGRDLPPFVPLIEDQTFMASLSARDKLDLGEPLMQTAAYAQAFLRKQRTLIQPAEQRQDEAFLRSIRLIPERYSFREVPEQRPCQKPTLIVTGRQDTVTGYRDAWTLLEHYPRATFAVLDGAAHEWPLPGQQRLFAALVNDWLDRIEGQREAMQQEIGQML